MTCELCINKAVISKQINQSSPMPPFNHVSNKGMLKYSQTGLRIWNICPQSSVAIPVSNSRRKT